MAYYHDGIGYAFLATPRTASRSVRTALQDIGFERVRGHHSGLDVVEKGVISAATFIRDPADILASWVRRNVKPSMTPEEIVEQEVETNEWIKHGKVAHTHIADADTILKFEDGLKPELNRWLSGTDYQVGKIPEIGVTQREDLTERQLELIKNYTRDERKKLGYI